MACSIAQPLNRQARLFSLDVSKPVRSRCLSSVYPLNRPTVSPLCHRSATSSYDMLWCLRLKMAWAKVPVDQGGSVSLQVPLARLRPSIATMLGQRSLIARAASSKVRRCDTDS